MLPTSFVTLDYRSGGRTVMAVVPETNVADYAACAIPVKGRGRRLVEGIVILRKLWTETACSFQGAFLQRLA
jgi:alkanesulfonate monooxygenase SsuD/methylene tetrahydromethanopterin reductase-like flavin-dependent oxidoreductase (luciferase family)